MGVSNLVQLANGGDNKKFKHCKRHGPYEIKNQLDMPEGVCATIPPSCPTCELEKAERQEFAKQKRAREIKRNLAESGIPPRFQEKSFANYEVSIPEQKHALRVCQDYADNFEKVLKLGQCLILAGTPGAGKNHLANAIGNEVIQRGFVAKFIGLRALVTSVKETWRPSSRKIESEVIQSYVAPDLLIIDEIGRQFDSDAENLIIFDIINGRYEHMKPTIIISNFPMESSEGRTLKTLLGDAVLDRLREGGGKLIKFNWKSHRK